MYAIALLSILYIIWHCCCSSSSLYELQIYLKWSPKDDCTSVTPNPINHLLTVADDLWYIFCHFTCLRAAQILQERTCSFRCSNLIHPTLFSLVSYLIKLWLHQRPDISWQRSQSELNSYTYRKTLDLAVKRTRMKFLWLCSGSSLFFGNRVGVKYIFIFLGATQF